MENILTVEEMYKKGKKWIDLFLSFRKIWLYRYEKQISIVCGLLETLKNTGKQLSLMLGRYH